MASPILRLNAKVTGPSDEQRLTITFSHPAAAEVYHQYLQHLDDMAIQPKQDSKIEESGKEVSMRLPSNIKPIKEKGAKDVVLEFEDEGEAMVWEQKMMLWTGNIEKKRSLSRFERVHALRDKIEAAVGEAMEKHRSETEARIVIVKSTGVIASLHSLARLALGERENRPDLELFED
jgi:hypothetical protein